MPGRGAGLGLLDTALLFTLLPDLSWYLLVGLCHTPRVSPGWVLGAPSIDVARPSEKTPCGKPRSGGDEIRVCPLQTKDLWQSAMLCHRS